jgi:hypothetical protein
LFIKGAAMTDDLTNAQNAQPRSRREFLRSSVAAGIALAAGGTGLSSPTPKDASELLVHKLYDSLTEDQKKVVAFAWNHRDGRRGVLRTHISNNWRITPPAIRSNFFTRDQQDLIRAIFEGLVQRDWIRKFDQQFRDDMGGFGTTQSIALFGQPGRGNFEFVLTGRHGTFRCDGNSTDHMAFGGPIVYGHAASGYYEKPDHPNNIFWPQAQLANRLYGMLDGRQRKLALCREAPDEAQIAFRDPKTFEGIPVGELSRDQKAHVQQVLQRLIEPFRQCDQDEVVAALRQQGGLDKCNIAFYQADDLGDDGVWDNWRLEGPAFVWHYRGAPHVHVWVHVADDPRERLNAHNDSGPLRQKP